MAEASAHILIVDDDADIRNLLRTRLEAQHYRVRVAENGEAALAAIAVDHPDLVITDWMMPGVDGLGLVQAVRGDPTTVSIPVILLTARGTTTERSEGIEAGADDYLAKPIQFRELFAKINALLRRSHLQRGPVSHMHDLDDTSGFIAGVPLATVLQMLQVDNRSCRLDIFSPDGSGSLACNGGQLIDARTGDLRGEEAAYRILGWRGSRIAIRGVDGPIAETTIRMPLAYLLMEAVRREDDHGRADLAQNAAELDQVVSIDPVKLAGSWPTATSTSTQRNVPAGHLSTPRQADQITDSILGLSRFAPPTREEARRTGNLRLTRETSEITPVRLMFIDGPRRGEEVVLSKAVTSLGRSRGNDIVIQSAEVSRHHARLEFFDQKLQVVDLNSTNGTRVNGKAVRSHPVRVGDEIVFGIIKASILPVDDPA
ncbi:MAG: response regulator [Thermomicrobiales bacterium]